jgi:hypothetical protein
LQLLEENRKAEQVLPGVLGKSGRGENVGKGYRRVSMVPILYTHVYKRKNETC